MGVHLARVLDNGSVVQFAILQRHFLRIYQRTNRETLINVIHLLVLTENGRHQHCGPGRLHPLPNGGQLLAHILAQILRPVSCNHYQQLPVDVGQMVVLEIGHCSRGMRRCLVHIVADRFVHCAARRLRRPEV